MSKTEWQPIETAPKDRWVIVGRHGHRPEMAIWEDASVWIEGWYCGGSRSDSYGPGFDPTHWAPLTEPPEVQP